MLTNENNLLDTKSVYYFHNYSELVTGSNFKKKGILVSYKSAEGKISAEDFQKPKRKVSKVFIHCSADSSPKNDDILVMKQWHLKRGFSDVGYHYFIKKDGTLQKGRSLELIPAAQKGHNTGSIAICLHGGGEDSRGGYNNDFTNAQYDTLKSLCKSINDAYNSNITFHGHCEVSDKACPVFDYKTVLKLKNGKLR